MHIMPAARRALSSLDMSVSSMRTGTRCCIFTKLPAELSVGTIEYLEPVAELMAVMRPLKVLSLNASTVTSTSWQLTMRRLASLYSWLPPFTGVGDDGRQRLSGINQLSFFDGAST